MTDGRSGYLVETDWLNERLEAQSLRVLDVTGRHCQRKAAVPHNLSRLWFQAEI